MNRKLLIVICIASVALVAGFGVQQYLAKLGGSRVQTASLDITLPDLADRPQTVSQWQGKILVINFWATWCPPCLKEIPEFVKLQAEYQDKGVQFVGIAIEDKAPVQEYRQRVEVNYPLLIGGEGAAMLAQQMGNIINSVPFTVIINQQGQIVHRQMGELSREQIVEVITPLLKAK